MSSITAPKQRPAPVLVFSALCALQSLWLGAGLGRGWSAIVYLARTGSISMIMFLGMLTYPALLLLTSFLLFRMKRHAAPLLTVCLALAVARLTSLPATSLSCFAVAWLAAATIYAYALRRSGTFG